MKKIGVFTSGGDSPGMNAAIRAVVRSATYYNIQTVGIYRGYEGLIDGDFIELTASSVANIIQRGGTILRTARSKRFLTPEGQQQAYQNLVNAQIDGLVACGGDGTFKGALEFGNKYNFPIVGIPGTIDNDLIGTDFTIGYDTAINTVIEAVDKIRDTANSHNRVFFVEVMGRDAGLIALRSGIGAGASAIFIPETYSDIDLLIKKLGNENNRKKSGHIVMVAEGDETGGAQAVAQKVLEKLPHLDARVTVLGHIQRGGSPTCMDRILASQMGLFAVEALLNNKKGVMIGIVDKKLTYTPFENAVKHIEKPHPHLLHLIDVLSV
jgi:6-phosphofructokinase 1